MKQNKYFNFLNSDGSIKIYNSFILIEPILVNIRPYELKYCYQIEMLDNLPTFAHKNYSGMTTCTSLYDFLKENWGYDTPSFTNSDFEKFYNDY